MEQIIRLEAKGRKDWTGALIELPTLHRDQAKAYTKPGRFKAVRCGRRWGKTMLGETVAADAALKGQFVGWFSPEYKFQAEAYSDIIDILAPAIWRSSKVEGVIRTTTGGRIDFWTLDNPHAGRSRRYHKVVIDEAAFAKPIMKDTWRKAIRPTLVDYRGSALVLSNTNGIDPENFFWSICNDQESEFVEYHAPTSGNPYMPEQELADIEAKTHPLVWQQEYLAEFIDWSGAAFFSLQSLLDQGQPVQYPTLCDAVFCTIDTAIKDRSQHDGTATIYWALNEHMPGPKLTILDYEIFNIEGSLLEHWLPSVFQRMEDLARQTHARFGARGAWIEDANTGTILLQQGRRRGWPTQAIQTDLAALGKDARAVNVSGYVHQGQIKISRHAYDKDLIYKDVSRNHLLGQLTGFRIGKDTRFDDLVDCFTYGIAIALGDQAGF
jgi:hypothetical protein